uniref:Striatin, calmodulin binding protein n=1 Tax=Nothobranchius korthausae TaxID=1143690 RepID=A0A1A8H501_9TELE
MHKYSAQPSNVKRMKRSDAGKRGMGILLAATTTAAAQQRASLAPINMLTHADGSLEKDECVYIIGVYRDTPFCTLLPSRGQGGCPYVTVTRAEQDENYTDDEETNR